MHGCFSTARGRDANLQGSELVRLENSETYPVKLKQLMEEVRFARESH